MRIQCGSTQDQKVKGLNSELCFVSPEVQLSDSFLALVLKEQSFGLCIFRNTSSSKKAYSINKMCCFLRTLFSVLRRISKERLWDKQRNTSVLGYQKLKPWINKTCNRDPRCSCVHRVMTTRYSLQLHSNKIKTIIKKTHQIWPYSTCVVNRSLVLILWVVPLVYTIHHHLIAQNILRFVLGYFFSF